MCSLRKLGSRFSFNPWTYLSWNLVFLLFTHIIPRCEHWDSRFTNHVYNRHVIGQKVCDPDESLLKGTAIPVFERDLFKPIRVHISRLLIAYCKQSRRKRCTCIVQRACKNTRLVRYVDKNGFEWEKKRRRRRRERGGETLTTTRPRSWLEWHFRESALPVEFYFFPPLSLFFPPVFSMLPYFVQEVSKGQATPIVPWYITALFSLL